MQICTVDSPVQPNKPMQFSSTPMQPDRLIQASQQTHLCTVRIQSGKLIMQLSRPSTVTQLTRLCRAVDSPIQLSRTFMQPDRRTHATRKTHQCSSREKTCPCSSVDSTMQLSRLTYRVRQTYICCQVNSSVQISELTFAAQQIHLYNSEDFLCSSLD